MKSKPWWGLLGIHPAGDWEVWVFVNVDEFEPPDAVLVSAGLESLPACLLATCLADMGHDVEVL